MKPGVGACSGSNANLRCDNSPTTNFTVFYYDTIYGVKSVSTNPCEYRWINSWLLFKLLKKNRTSIERIRLFEENKFCKIEIH